MRIWDVPPAELCRVHLLGEHRELHALWTILSQDRAGYRRHPETKRWEGKLAALYQRHEQLVSEMHRRGYRHRSELDAALATGLSRQDDFVDSIDRQRELLSEKHCECYPTAVAESRHSPAKTAPPTWVNPGSGALS